MKRQQQQQQIITIQIFAPTAINLQIFDECAESRNLKTSLKTTFYVNICRTNSIIKYKALNHPLPFPQKRDFSSRSPDIFKQKGEEKKVQTSTLEYCLTKHKIPVVKSTRYAWLNEYLREIGKHW